MLRKIIHVFLSVVIMLNLVTVNVKSFSSSSIPKDCYNQALAEYRSHNGQSRYLIVVDFDLPSSAKRLWIVDMQSGDVVLNTYVSHGENSGDKYATSFSNENGSHKSSLGTYKTLGTYTGHNGRSMKIRGLDRTNSNAEKRMVVIHGAWYADKGGRSWGCFAVPHADMKKILDLIEPGTILVAYHS
jgi:hypothetical protein